MTNHDVTPEAFAELAAKVDELSEELAALRGDITHVSRQVADLLRHPSAPGLGEARFA